VVDGSLHVLRLSPECLQHTHAVPPATTHAPSMQSPTPSTHTTNNTPVRFAGVAAFVGRTHIGMTPDTTQLTAATTTKMRAAIVAGAQHPVVVAATQRALYAGAVTDWTDHRAVCLAIWEYVRTRVRFVSDDDVLRAELGLANELELLIEPALLLSMAQPAGDCDDFTMLTGAMLLSAGLPGVEVYTIAADSADSTRWSHVYLRATVRGGALVMDCSHGAYLGWEAPQYYKQRGWGVITAPPTALETHNRAIIAQGAQMHGLRSNQTRPGTPGSIRGVSGLGAMDWGAFATQVTTGTIDVIKQVTQKPGQYIQGGSGVIASNVPGAQPYPGGGISLQTPFGGGVLGGGDNTSTLLLLGGAALLAVVLLKR